ADLARQGIGSYEPYLQAGSQAVTQGMGLTQQGVQQLGNLDVSPQFGAAQGAFQGALGATSRLGGLGDVAAGYSAADTRRATQQLEDAMQGAGGIEAAGAGALQAGVGAAGLMQGYATSARAQEDAITGGIGALRTARQGLSPYMQAGLTSSEGLLGEAAAAARTGAPLTFATERDLLSTARGIAGTASTEANLAARLGEAPTYAGASMTGPGGISAQQVGTQGISAAAASPVTAGLRTYQMGPAQQVAASQQQSPEMRAALTGFRPNLQTFQMGAVRDITAPERIGIGALEAAQTSYAPRLQAYQMGPAQQVSTQSFTAPGTAQDFMSPYMQGVVAIQQREAQRQAD
ncbi:MAG: hypothetical protein ACO3CJ_10100, partial [Burkholderiaceae bacterium]